jgi:hypothetical protein
MVPVIPSEILTGGIELVCCGLTAAAAVLSYVFMLR